MISTKHGTDLTLGIATGKSRRETKWKNITVTWPELVTKLSETVKTHETMNEYMSMKKDEQDSIKDVGGFVGGELKEGRRKNGYVKNRSVVTLDVDYGVPGLWDDIELLADYAMVAYSTHKHTAMKPRIRLIIPLDRKVSPEEYEAIARKLADEIGMDYFDDTTYEPARLMFWPSTPKDIDYFFKFVDLPILSADKVLAKYPDWKDTSYWPESSRVNKVRVKSAAKQGDPLSKEGLIGAFCRSYSIQEAIEKFIPEEYTVGSNGRYTYAHGSTYGGLVIYNDKFAYSNHSTDPTGGMLCNAFDLVRIHKFHTEDEEAKEGTPVNKLPSWKAMMDLVRNDEEVRATIATESLEGARSDFLTGNEENTILDEISGQNEEADKDWTKKLTLGKNGCFEATLDNILLILNNDENLKGTKGIGGKDLLSGRNVILNRHLPWPSRNEYWSDTDDAGLRWYLESVYRIEGRQKIGDAIDLVIHTNSYHPVRDYLNSLKWDGTPRVETLLVDYLGADNTEYVRTITRKTLVAAVARAFDPGCKFDYMLTLVGPQGIGKSLLINKLGGDWFSDTLTDIKGKESYEALDGVWIMEMGELTALKKSERETIKQYISKQTDTYRRAFEKNTTVNKRQCIFIGTTNDNEFLNDTTGNRRFWVVDTHVERRTKTVWGDFSKEERNQVWAEAVELYRAGEEINGLPEEILAAAIEIQQAHSEDNDMLGIIERYLAIKVPERWGTMSIAERCQWVNATEEFRNDSGDGLKERTRVSAIEVWCECMSKNKADITNMQARKINDSIKKLGWIKQEKPANYGPYGTQRGFIKNVTSE